MKNFLSIRFLNQDDVIRLVIESLRMIPYYCKNEIVPLPLPHNMCRPPKLTSVFTELSTRTKSSFEEAAELVSFRVGAAITPSDSSLGKNESLTNTLRMIIQQNADVVVLRSGIEGAGLHLANCLQQTANSANWVNSNASVIIGGAGTCDHPSQVLLDIVTIIARSLGITRNDQYHVIETIFADIDYEKILTQAIVRVLNNLTIAFVGDLVHSRVVHDWLHLGRLFFIRFTLIAPDVLQIPISCLKGIIYKRSNDLDEALNSEITYTIRLQKERLERIFSVNEVIKIISSLQVTKNYLSKYKGLIMDAQPIDSGTPMISPDCFNYPQVIMFQQSAMGIPVRMAILASCFIGEPEKIVLLKPCKVRPKVLKQESIQKHLIELTDKYADKELSVNPIRRGTVLDRLDSGTIKIIDLLLEKAGAYKKGQGPIIQARNCPSPSMGKKEILFLPDRFIPYWLLAVIKLIAPSMRVIVLKNNTYKKLEFPVARSVPDIFVCPNPNCITNHDPEAKTAFDVIGDHNIKCVYCENVSTKGEIIAHL